MSDRRLGPDVVVHHDLAEVFRVHCEAWALLFKLGELDLQQAVDLLQHDAMRNGVVDLIGQDEVQEIMAKAFEEVRRQ